MASLLSPVIRRILFLFLLIPGLLFFSNLKSDLQKTSASPQVGENEENEAAVIAEYFQYRTDQMKDKSGRIPDGSLIEALNERESMEQQPESSGQIAPMMAGMDKSYWTYAGPGNVGGRIRAILPIDASTVFVGGVSGGIWKTTNCCSVSTTWAPVDDFMANLGVGTLILDPTNANVMYAGTGEGMASVPTGIRGAGVFKSTDGGTTWTQLSSTNNSSWYFVNRLAISPNGANLLAATSTGLYHSTDGGATWIRRITGNWKDVRFDPISGNNAVAGGTGYSWYSTTVGTTNTWAAATGLPAAGRIELTYAPSNPSIVYASVDQNSGDVYKSTDGGHSYTRVNTGMGYLGTQGGYDNTIWVKPDDPNTVVVAGLNMYKSTDGAVTFTQISRWDYSWHYKDPPSPHADHHALVSIPGSNTALLNGNDGGIYYTADIATAGTNADYNLGWVYMNNNLGITQYYGVAGNSNGVLYGGAQDNGVTRYTPASGANAWTYASGGDGGKSAADPTNPNYLYNEYIYGQVSRSSDGGATTDYIYGTYWNGAAWVCRDAPYVITDACNEQGSFIAPILLDPNNANRLFVGGLSLWVTNDARTPYVWNSATGGPQWEAIKPSIASGIMSIAVAPSNSNTIWVGYKNSRIDMTTDGGTTWTQVDTNIGVNNPGTTIGSIAIDKNDSNIVYVGFWGFGPNRVWRTADGGATWTNITNNLPQTPVYAIAINPSNSAWLYVGTETGVFASENTGGNWNVPAGAAYGDGPANVSTHDLQWMGGGNSTGSSILIAGTHGRGAWTIDVTSPSVTNTYADPDLVCDGNIPCYATITEALNNVHSGGTVTIYAGTYAESVTVNKNVTVNVLGNITVNDVSLYSGTTWNANSWTMSAGNVNLYGGTWNANTSALSIDDFNSTGGTWNAASSTMTVNGNWAAGGTFNPGTGMVVFAKNGVVTVNSPAQTAGTLSFCNVTIDANTTVDVTDDFISAATGGSCTQYVQNGKLRHTTPKQYIINYNAWTFKDARNRDTVVLTKTAGVSLWNTYVTVTSNLQPPATCGSNAFPAQPVLRQYDIVPTQLGGTYTMRLYYSASNPDESNGNPSGNLAIYHCNSSTGNWEKFTGTSGSDTNGIYVQASVNSFTGSVFAIGSNTLPNHTVTFNNNGGIGTMTAQSANVPTALIANTFTRAGYTFAGWNTAANGSGTVYADGASYSFAADITLYAQWTQNEYTLTVISAHGTVTRDNNGPYHLNDVVTLTAAADAGWTFTGWTPALTDNKVTITGNTTVTANYSQDEYTLTVLSDHGTVTRDNNGPYHLNDVVTLTVVADEGWTFTGWTPALVADKVTITGNTTVTANYSQDEYTLTVITAHGTVTRDNNGPYHLNDVVTLTAAADEGWTFTGWTPALTDNKVTITGNTTVTANYSQDEYTLTVVSAHGTVTRDNNGPYHLNDVVTLTATADNSWTFTGWTPALVANKVTITGDTTVTANYSQNEYTLTVISAHGTVTRDNNGPYHLNDVVTLTATADNGWTFTGWTPALVANKVTITGNTTVTANYAQDEYMLTVVSDHGTVTRDNNGPYHLNDVVTLTAVADTGWTFTGWTPSLIDNKVTITGNTIVTANYSQDEYTLTVVSDHGTVTRDNNGPYHLNDVVTLTAVADEGWTFTGWTPTLADNKVTITGNTTITANYSQDEYTLTVISAHGTVTRDNNGPYHLNDVVTLTAVADAGWTFTGWTPALVADEVTITGNTTVTANFTQNEYSLTVVTTHGTVTRDNNGPYHLNDVVTLTATADAGWTFTGWTPALIADKVTITGNTTVTANYSQDEYTLTVISAHGTVTRDNNGPYHLNDVVTLTATADAGWTFTGWTPSLLDNKVTITGNTTVTANYSQDEYALAYSAGVGGTLTGNTSQTVAHGADGTAVTAVPNAGYHFVDWSDGSTANPRTDTNVTANLSVTANFAVNTFTLTYTAGANGSLTGTTSQTVNYGGDGTAVTAIPALGYHFVDWSDGSTANPRTDTNVTANVSVTANFVVNTFTLTYTAGANGTLTGTTSQTVNYGGDGTAVTAVPALGYHFVDWSDGSTANPRTDTNVMANVSVTAYFAVDTFTLNYAAGAGGTLTGTTLQTVNYGESGTAVTAVPTLGYHFINWSDSLTANPRTDINVTANLSVTANYSQDEYTLTVVSDHGTVTRDNIGPYHLNDVVTLTAAADEGWTFTSWTPALTDNKVTITGNTTVTANYSQDEYTLTVISDHGTVTRDNNGPYHLNDVVTLTVAADEGWTFTGWTPSLTDNKVTITGNTTVTANYAQDEYTLTVVSAHGTVTRDNNGPYHLNDVVTLSVTADEGWTFTGWTPALTDNKVTITGNTTVTANYAQDEYTLTVVSDHGTVTRDNNGPYHLNDVVTLTAAADAGWTFTGWTPALTDNKVTITGNTTVTANYSQDEYTLTVVSDHGTVTRDNNGPYHLNDVVTLTVVPDAGWTFTGWTPALIANKVTITGNTTVTANYSQDEYTLTVVSAHGTVTKSPDKATYTLGEEVTLSVATDEGWTFTGWTPSLTDNKVTVTGNTTVTANYSQDEYMLTVVSAHGTVTRDNNGPYHLNDVVTLSATADAGWSFTGWTPSLTDNKVTINGNTTVTANYSQDEYTLTVVSAHGTVTKSPDKPSYQYGEEVTLGVAADTGWTFTGWTPSLTDNKVTITGNTAVTANFTQNEYTLTVNSAHGTVTKSPDKPSYQYGEEVALSVTADAGWMFTGWTPSLTDNKVTITGDTTVTANFTQNSYNLEVSVIGSGAVSKLPDQPNYTVGSEVQLTATAVPGWTFSGWSGDASGSTNPLNVTMDGNKSITATFIQNTYTLAVTVVGNGVVTRNNDGPYHLNDEVILTATPDLGWSFAEWGGDAMGSANQFTITIDGDKSVTATFLQSEYTLNVLTSGNGTVTRDNNGPYHLNDQVTLTAIPDAGWTFSGWDGSGCSGINVCVVTVDDNKTVTAVFLPIEYVLTVNTTGSGAVTRNPERATYHYGEMVELTAVAGSDWTFDSWGDALSGNTNPQYVTINGDMTVSAAFVQGSHTLDVSVVGNGTVSKSPDQPNYLSGSTVQLTATAESGWQFSGWSGDVSGNTNPLNVTMNSNKSITATFTVIPPTCYPLTLSHAGQGSDPVASPANSAGCSAGHYLAGTSIDLSGAVPTTGWQISGWDGTNNNASTAEINSVTMPASAHTASVSYTQINYSLTITIAGSGSVAKSPNQTTYHYGDIVQLTATPASGWSFTSWSNNLSGTTNPVSLTIDGNKSVTATFSQTPTSLAYGVHDEATNNTQFFTINPQTLATAALGSLQKGYDIEAISLHPTTSAFYATSGADNTRKQRGYLFSVNKQTGALTAIGYTGYNSVPGLSFRNDGMLWGWASGKGLIQINLSTGKGTVKYSSSLTVGDIAWNNSGTILYIVTTNGRLYSYNPANNKLTLFADNLPSNVEALDMRADGLLVMGIHDSTRIRAYDPIQKKFVSNQYMQTIYNDVEGIAWP